MSILLFLLFFRLFSYHLEEYSLIGRNREGARLLLSKQSDRQIVSCWIGERARNLRKDNFWAGFAIFVMLIVIFGGLANYYIYNKYEQVLRSKEQSLRKVSENLSHRMDGSMTAMRLLADDPEIAAMNPPEARPELIRAMHTLNFKNLSLFDKEGFLLVDAAQGKSKVAQDIDSFEQVVRGMPVISGRIVLDDFTDAFVTLRVPVYNDSGKEKQIHGVLSAAIPLTEIRSMVEQGEMPPEQIIIILDEANKFVYHPQMDQLYPENSEVLAQLLPMTAGDRLSYITSDVLDGVSRLYIYAPLKHTGWRVAVAVPVWGIYREVAAVLALAFFVFILLSGFSFLSYRHIQANNRYRKAMESIRVERMAAATQMAAEIAHEVRNPLTSIKGFIQLILHKTDKSKIDNYLEIILAEIDRIDSLVGEFQLLARPLKLPTLRKTDLAKLVGDVVMLMEGQAQAKNIVLEYALQGELFEQSGFEVNADSAQLKQVLINLLRNAFDAEQPGGNVKVSLNKTSDWVSIMVEDDGGGIPEETLKKIGTPFFTTKEFGTGLGLSLCFTIMNNHGGQLKAASKLGEGTVFTMLLPSYEASKNLDLPQSE